MSESNLALPGNPRYQPANLRSHFGYDRLYIGVGRVELASFDVLAEMNVIPSEDAEKLTPELREAILGLRTTEIDETERQITKHDIRAWILEARKLVPPEVGRWLHVMLTSYDPLDTGRILQYLEAHRQVVVPACQSVLKNIADLVERHASEPQIGRTHGQHALPITVGFWLATILERIFFNYRKMEEHANELVGKISGAVGAYNAQVGLGVLPLVAMSGELTFEERVLAKLGLKPAPISTQILPPEPLAYYLFSCLMLSGSIAQLGRDCRNLMRSEVGEVGEEFVRGQSGSSTMAHKRNPVTFEQLEGMYTKTVAEFGKVLMTLVSEHQRDLTGSCVARDFSTIVVNLMVQLNALLRENDSGVPFVSRISINPEACQRNFTQSRDVILAEPLYIALQMAGYEGDAHELVNHTLVPRATSARRSLVDVAADYAAEDSGFRKVWHRIPLDISYLLYHPETYTGRATQKALQVVREVRTFLAVV